MFDEDVEDLHSLGIIGFESHFEIFQPSRHKEVKTESVEPCTDAQSSYFGFMILNVPNFVYSLKQTLKQGFK